MPILVKDEFDIINPTPGMVDAVLQGVYDIGTQKSIFNGKESFKHQVMFVWEITEVIPRGKFQGQRFAIRKNYNLAFGSLATLRKDLESWFSKKMSEEKAKEGIDLETLIGRRATLNLMHSDDGRYVNISSVMPATTANQLTSLISGVPKFVEKAIERSVEWKKEHDGIQDDFGGSSPASENHLDGLPF